MAHVDPGELKWNITIIVPTMRIDENNHYVRGTDKMIDARAAVRAVKSQDTVEAGAERRRETLQFIIRWRCGLNTAAQVLFKGQRYEVESVDPTPFAGGYMRIRAISYDTGVGE